MLLKFLEDQKIKLIEKKESLEKDLSTIEAKIHETEKFKELLSKENEPVFSEFSPHTVSTRAEEKIAELDAALSSMEEKRASLADELNINEKTLSELTEALAEAKKLQPVSTGGGSSPVTELSIELVDPAETKNPEEEKQESTDSLDKEKLISRLQQILGVAFTDPFLTQSLIASLINELSE